MKTRTITMEAAAARIAVLTGAQELSARRIRQLRQSGKLGAAWDEQARRWLCSESDIQRCAAQLDTSRRRKQNGAPVSRNTDYRRRKVTGNVRAYNRRES
jgi:hypothetical protein